ncbi:hypothetical protein [Stenotrophomonas sp.]|uniref:hypothetical protein n=1 Tax=Stenotrophomonas sp. TaxID=69392 RepID=UPI0028A9E8B5|nr:hypothetical protein [Stenotrophomonas sp.]
MKQVFGNLMLALPPLASFVVWRTGAWAFDYFGCQDLGKSIEPCIAYGHNIQGVLGISLFWAPLLLLVSLPVCGWLLFERLLRRLHTNGS